MRNMVRALIYILMRKNVVVPTKLFDIVFARIVERLVMVEAHCSVIPSLFARPFHILQTPHDGSYSIYMTSRDVSIVFEKIVHTMVLLSSINIKIHKK